MPEISDDYMKSMVHRIVSHTSEYWEDALQEARIAKWLYRDSSVTWQIHQIQWRVRDMFRMLNGRRHLKPHVAAASLDVLVDSPDSHSPAAFSEMVPDERFERRVEVTATLMDVEQALQHERKRDIEWLMRNARGESHVEIARSAGYSASFVSLVLRDVRVRIRKATAA